jgi:prepilin-type N-terminal cleavage/methylation domain-containing protein/prepilin-type processing-associated H-X9-DG protein
MKCKYFNTFHARKSARGFSLIELLVVVAVISLLLAILLPALGKARAMAVRAFCQSNLKHIALAWHAYFEDNKGSFYQGVNHQYDFGGWQGNPTNALFRPLNKYLSLPVQMPTEDGAEVFKCPADEGGQTWPDPAYLRLGNSYQVNTILGGPDQLQAQPWYPDPWRTMNKEINKYLRNLKFERVSEPSHLLLVGDHNWITQWDPLWTLSCGKAWHGKRHTYNIAFLDCHVEHIKIHKGLYVTPEYNVQPFNKLNSLVSEEQEEVPCACGEE